MVALYQPNCHHTQRSLLVPQSTGSSLVFGRLQTLSIGLQQLLPFKIHSNFKSSNKLTKFFAIPIISIKVPLKIFVLPCTTSNLSKITYSISYGWFNLSLSSYLSIDGKNYLFGQKHHIG